MFRFSIREVLWLTVVVGLIVALWIDHLDLAAVREHALVLRQNLEIACWRFEHSGALAAPDAVDWNLLDEPIP